MSDSLKRQWETLKDGRPGQRFQARYEAAQKAREGRMTRIFRIIVALGAVLIGIVLIFIPGPAILFFLVAAGLMAAESLTVARLLDRIDVRTELAWKWIKLHWKKLHVVGKIVLSGLVLIGAGGCVYAAYRVLIG